MSDRAFLQIPSFFSSLEFNICCAVLSARTPLALEVDTFQTSRKVAAVLYRTALSLGLPKEMLTDNGSKFTGNVLNAWEHDSVVEHLFTDPGCPTQNGYIESFNGKLRNKCLNQHWLSNLYEAIDIIEQWRVE